MSLNEKKAGFNTITLHFMAFIVFTCKKRVYSGKQLLKNLFQKRKISFLKTEEHIS